MLGYFKFGFVAFCILLDAVTFFECNQFEQRFVFWGEVCGLVCCIMFANFSQFCFMLLSRLHFCVTLSDLSSQRGSLLGSVLANVADFEQKKAIEIEN